MCHFTAIEVTEDHPDVQALVEEAMKEAAESPVTASRELYLEALEKYIREVTAVLPPSALIHRTTLFVF